MSRKNATRSGLGIMARLIVLVGPLLPFMVLAIALGVAGFLCATAITVLGGWAMLDVMGLDAPMSFILLFHFLALAAVLRGFLRYGEQACNHFIAFKLLALVRDKVFGALRRLCPAKLEGRDRGDLIALITSDIELLEVFYAHTISPAAIALIMSVIMAVFIGSFHPLLGIVAAVAYVTVGLALPFLISRSTGDAGKRFRAGAGALSGFVLDSLRGLREILQYRRGAQRLEELDARTAALSDTERQLKDAAARGTALTNTVILFFDLAMLLAAALLFQAGRVGFDGVLIPLVALMSSFGPVVALANLGSTLQNTLAAGGRVLDLLDEAPLVEEVSGKAPVSFSGGSCEHVTFSYGEETILSDLSLDIRKGEILGIIGPSGSGKSTLLRLFMRFWDVNRGAVKLSGADVKDINTADLRQMEALVTQDTHLFHDSIANNLRIAKPDATREELEEACRKASVHDFILSLPKGYDTPVGELGDTLSGGERQRLGLARAFLHGAPLLLLDEPTSNLDSLNEAVILKALREEQGDRTVVLVSHRASTMGIAHRVCRVTNGRLS
ncbi:amino acid ABC transporter ATP-binding/permease protein [uncultured Pseudoflavonifractor sp.]|uniref:amino acid ABC transporter ATP-binding/permease protein n=1 Tax=uncultured Pseudoflavonifractor sp. TaxID=1221379 RepID=UPI0025E83809|nr:ABC transporter ATP-binding protein [uncultured Pseudoflavonifractor sp.]